jgi:hypothetical protein
MQDRMMTKRLLGIALWVSASFLGACGGSSSPPPPSSGTESQNTEYKVVSDAAVAKGLNELSVIQADIMATLATDPAGAKTKITKLYDKWFEFEGTIRQNEKKTIYLDMEDSLSNFKAGVQANDPTKAAKGTADFATATVAYLQKHPGGTP